MTLRDFTALQVKTTPHIPTHFRPTLIVKEIDEDVKNLIYVSYEDWDEATNMSYNYQIQFSFIGCHYIDRIMYVSDHECVCLDHMSCYVCIVFVQVKFLGD